MKSTQGGYSREYLQGIIDRHRLNAQKVDRKLSELDRLRQMYLEKYIKIVCWFDEDFEVKSFFPEEPIPEASESELIGFDSTLKVQYQYKGVEVSSYYAVKYQLPYVIRRYPRLQFKHPINLHFKKAGKDVLFDVHYLFDRSNFVSIGYEKKNNRINYHKVIIPYKIYYDWRKCWDEGVQGSLF